MIAVDSSVAIAAFGPWHERHEDAADILARGAAIPAHALLETYSVLTGFPPPHRAPAGVVEEWLADRFPRVLEPPDAARHRDLVRRLAAAGRIGGSVYDALVAATAQAAGAELFTADRRARAVYDLVGVRVRELAPSTSRPRGRPRP